MSILFENSVMSSHYLKATRNMLSLEHVKLISSRTHKLKMYEQLIELEPMT